MGLLSFMFLNCVFYGGMILIVHGVYSLFLIGRDAIRNLLEDRSLNSSFRAVGRAAPRGDITLVVSPPQKDPYLEYGEAEVEMLLL